MTNTAKKLGPSQIAALRRLANAPASAGTVVTLLSDYRHATVYSLIRRGLIRRENEETQTGAWLVTDAGRAALVAALAAK